MTIRSRAAFSEILSKRPGPLSAQEEADLLDSLIFQGGSSSSPQTSSAASYNFAGVWTESTDATGTDQRGLYWRHYLSGAGPSGEAGRFYLTINGAGAVGAHGIHVSTSFGTNGTVTGEAAALRATLQVPNKSLGGTTAAVYAELWADGASSANGGTMAFMRCVLGGNATGLAAVEDTAHLLSIEGGTLNTGNMVRAKASAAVSHVIRINIYGTTYYLMVSDQI